jgi:lipoprotein-anchoring transpeptidase ErfK/SrfK
MLRKYACLIAATAVGAAGAACAQPAAAPSAPTPPPAVIAPPAPAFKVGALVTDRTGARLGPIKSLAEGTRGPMVVIEIDGKLISVPQATLTLRGEGAASAQTKAEIIAAAAAPP